MQSWLTSTPGPLFFCCHYVMDAYVCVLIDLLYVFLCVVCAIIVYSFDARSSVGDGQAGGQVVRGVRQRQLVPHGLHAPDVVAVPEVVDLRDPEVPQLEHA